MPEQWDVIDSPFASRFEGNADDDAGGTGLAREKHPVATLRVFTGLDDAEWLLYGGVRGGRQGNGWIEVYYEGIIPSDRKPTFGYWLLRIEGENLELLAHQLGKQLRNMLKVGKEEKYEVKAISLTPIDVTEHR